MEAKKPGNEKAVKMAPVNDDDFFYLGKEIIKHKKPKRVNFWDRTFVSRQKDIENRRAFKKSRGFISWRKLYFVYLEDYEKECMEFEKAHTPKKILEELEKQNELFKMIGLIR